MISDSPYWQAKRAYLKADNQEYTFEGVLKAHLDGGICVSTPEYFLMARPVAREASQELLSDPFLSFENLNPDAWFVYMAAGDISKGLWNNDLFGYKWIMFYRFDDKLRCYNSKHLKRLIHADLTMA